MADPISGLDMVREIIGQINNLRKLITIGGKQYRLDEKTKTYKADGKTFTRAQLRAKLEGQSYTAPKLDKKSKLKIKPKLKRTGKLSPGGISRPDKGRYGRNLPSKDKYGVPSQKKRLLKPKTKTKTKTTGGKSPDPWKGSYKTPKSDNLKIKEKIQKLTNKAKNTKDSIPTKKKGFFERYGVTQRDVQNVKATGKNKDGTYKMSKATRATVNQRNYGRKNAVLAILGKAADQATDQLVDRAARQIAGKSKMTLEEFRKARDAGELKGTLKKRLKIKSTNKTDNKKTDNKGNNSNYFKARKYNNPYVPQTDKDKDDIRKENELATLRKNQKDGKNISTKTATTKLTPAQKEERAKKKWLEKTRNSPARASGAFKDKELWELQKRHRA